MTRSLLSRERREIMLNIATEAQQAALDSVVDAVEETLFVLSELDPRTLPTERRMQYSAAYGLIRIGNAIEQQCSQLEQVFPDYAWARWVDLRDKLATQSERISPDDIARAVTEDAPQLVRHITGAEPNVGPKVRLEDLPLDVIADFCREWGIKEMCMIPRGESRMYFGGPFEGVELVFLVKYHDDAPGIKNHHSMGPLISKAIGVKTHVGRVPQPDSASEHSHQDEMIAHGVPVYVA